MDNKQPKISVIMATHNDESTISDSIESILKQTYQNIEFLIIDDYSTDETLKILKNFESKTKNIKIFENPKNVGLTKSLNILIRNASGDLIARQDADDISFSNRLFKQVHELIQNQLDFCTTRAIRSDSQKNIPGLSFFLPNKILMNYKNPFIHGTLLIKKEIFEKYGMYDESFYFAQDYELMKRLLHYKCNYKVLKDPEYLLNMTNNISNNFSKEQKRFSDLVKKLKYNK